MLFAEEDSAVVYMFFCTLLLLFRRFTARDDGSVCGHNFISSSSSFDEFIFWNFQDVCTSLSHHMVVLKEINFTQQVDAEEQQQEDTHITSP